ncbi:MAG: ribonuclease T [Acidobacteriota bacterium]|nr:ribonuclease T [Acidobacteriota bacterium]
MAAVVAGLLMLAGCRPQGQGAGSDGAQVRESARTEMHSEAQSGGGFDFYLLNLSWSPEFCHSHPDAAECAEHARFVLHGLWPERMDGTYPENCSTAPGPANPAQYADVYPEAGLLEHEWRAHGTCSGLSADAFFTAARTAYESVKIPAALATLTQQTMMPPDAIAGAFAAANPGFALGSVVVSCGHNYLTAVEVCVDKTLKPMACPTLRSCRANMVKIPAP